MGENISRASAFMAVLRSRPGSVSPRVACVALTAAFVGAFWPAPAQAVRALPSYTAQPLDSPAPQAGALFGDHVDAVGDLDGDGVNDVAVSSERQNAGAMPRIGVVWVFSGRTRGVIRTIQNPDPQPGHGFGDSILGIGDVNGDGVPDLMIAGAALDVYTGSGTPCGTDETPPKPPNGCNEAQGRVYVFSGKTGSLIRRIEDPTPQAGAFFGYGNVIAPGDLNGDGVPDFVVTSGETVDVLCDDDQDPATPPAKPCPSVGAAYAFSGKDGSLIHRFDDPDPEGYASFGSGTSSPGDVTGDGVGDLVIGAAFSSAGGHAYLFDGKTGALVHKFVNPDPNFDPTGGGFGFGIGHGIEPGDVNGDGVRDLIVAAPGHVAGGVANAGRLYLLSGKDFSLIRTLNDPNPKKSGSLGYFTAGAGDLNGDGFPDVLAARFIFPASAYAQDVPPTPPPGAAAYVFDGRTGAPLVTLPGMSQDGPGSELVSPGDVNGDGYPDYFLGGRLLDGGAGDQSGRVIVELSKAPPAQPGGQTPGTTTAPDTLAPVVSNFGLTNNPFVVSRSKTPTFGFSTAKKRKHKKGTTFRYTLSESATVKIAIARGRSGRRKGKRCVAPTHKLRKARKCVRLSLQGTLTRTSHKGANRVAFSGRIGSKALKPGRYQATLTATDGAKNKSKPKTITFSIVKR